MSNAIIRRKIRKIEAAKAVAALREKKEELVQTEIKEEAVVETVITESPVVEPAPAAPKKKKTTSTV